MHVPLKTSPSHLVYVVFIVPLSSRFLSRDGRLISSDRTHAIGVSWAHGDHRSSSVNSPYGVLPCSDLRTKPSRSTSDHRVSWPLRVRISQPITIRESPRGWGSCRAIDTFFRDNSSTPSGRAGFATSYSADGMKRRPPVVGEEGMHSP